MTQESLTYTAILEHVMDGMPGGVLVYRADEKEEILYANSWLIHIFGCHDMDDFMAVTGGSFKSLVYPPGCGEGGEGYRAPDFFRNQCI